jgi:hypothetical protein
MGTKVNWGVLANAIGHQLALMGFVHLAESQTQPKRFALHLPTGRM